MAAFRSLLFSKVVPNLRTLGLLTPRVREGFEQMGILRYERYVDSATEAGELDPADDIDTSDPLSAMRAALAGVEKIAPGPVLQVLQTAIDRERVLAAGDARIRLQVTGVDDGDWYIGVAGGDVDVHPSAAADATEVTITMDVETWTGIVTGRITPPGAFLEGKLDLQGDIAKALVVDALL
jgi:putative sterol carrier protein